MRLEIPALAMLAALMAPILAAKTWDVTWDNGIPKPQELDILPGDTVRWPNADGSHAIVETIPGPRTCTAKTGGFNSGTKPQGQAYQRTFPTAGVVNYKDGIGTNCQRGAMGTIYVGPRPANATATPSGTATATGAPTPTKTNGAMSLTPESSAMIGFVAMIGALVL
ncbi:hypothetical protein BGW42_006319 [Actinomortierella wolfii]|nr:hypothetical protein BGW42_006319 [Actinomortierella wolfii]